MLKPQDLQIYLESHNISGEILQLETPTPTVQTAAQAVSVAEDQIVKTVLFLIRDEPVAAITCGTARIDRRAIASVFQVGRKKVRLATADTVLAITGYPAGALPPFGHQSPLPTLLDPRVLTHHVVFAGGGAENALVRLNPQDIHQHTGAKVIDLLTPPEKVP